MCQNNALGLKCRKDELSFYTAFFILCFYRMIKNSAISFNDHSITYVVIISLLLVRIIKMHVRINDFLTVCVLCPMFILCLINTWDPLVPVVVMMLLAAKDIKFENIVRLSFWIMLILVLCIVTLSMIGVIDDFTSIRHLHGKVVVCHCAGFNHSSKLPTYFFFLFLEWFYLQRKKVGIISCCIWVLVGYAIFLFCGERLRFYNLIIATAFTQLFRVSNNKFKRGKKVVSIVIYPVLCLLTNWLGYIYNAANPILYELNILLSNRLYLENLAFNRFGITLFGQNIDMGEEAVFINGNMEYFYIDSGYVYIFVIYGIIVGAIILATYCIGSYKSFKINDEKLLVWFICMAIDPLVGNQMLSVWITPLLFVPFCKFDTYSGGSYIDSY